MNKYRYKVKLAMDEIKLLVEEVGYFFSFKNKQLFYVFESLRSN